jgi:homoserine kinase
MTDFPRRTHLRLPATSANLGPAFDTAAVALNLHLEVTAQPSETFSISARGRDSAACGRVERNLILETYRRILTENDRPVQPLHLDVNNEIPLGMGCGSSAAARLAGIALAVEFGELGWREEEILATATFLEGHPDNVTACWLGGTTVSVVSNRNADWTNHLQLPRVHVARIDIPEHWRAVVVFPREPVRTEESRKILPSHYSRADVVETLQHCSLLVAAFASGNGELLRAAMHDRLHQPYRSAICPLLQEVESLAAIPGVLGVALSGAGPGILLIVERDLDPNVLDSLLQQTLADASTLEILQCGFERQGAGSTATAGPAASSLEASNLACKK